MSEGILDAAEFNVFPTRWPNKESVDTYNLLFNFWHETWRQTFLELKGSENLSSDDFYRCDEVVGITKNSQVLGCFLYSWYDLNIHSHKLHSYFKSYPPEALNIFSDWRGHKLMSMGYLAVHPEWRRNKVGTLISECLLSLACKRFLESDAMHLIAYTRNDRKINDLCYRHGARCILANQRQHNVSVDVIAVDRDDVRITTDFSARALTERLWKNRVIHGQEAPLKRTRKAG